jgi:type IV secretory pathway TrbF-like protein
MSAEPFQAEIGGENGATLTPVPSDEWQRIDQAYREIARRDGQAEHRAWRKERLALVLLAVVVLMLGWNLWLWLDYRKVQAFVQVVVQDDKGQLLQVGIPQDLLAYTPPDGAWMDMLTEWVIRFRWRGEDTKALARREWAWLYRHTCGQARRLVQTWEDREKPFEPGKILRTVEVKSVTKTPVPESYQVLWVETSTGKGQPTVKEHSWTGTFSVGRMQLPTLTDALQNRLGLCVSAFDVSENAGGKP